MVIDSELLIRNCKTYSRRHIKAVDVLRLANGNNHYLKIAEKLKIHPTTVSNLLKQAAKMDLADKKGAFYKRKTGVLGYMPSPSIKKNSSISVSEMVAQMSSKKKRTNKGPLSLGGSFQDKAYRMSEAYKWLYITENTLRGLIRNVFRMEQDWWKNRVNPQIITSVEKAKAEYPYHGAIRKDELEYTHLGQLKEIIIAKDNWNLFLPFLKEKDKNNFKVIVDRAIPSRNSIAHCTPLSDEDCKVADVRFKDILKMIDI